MARRWSSSTTSSSARRRRERRLWQVAVAVAYGPSLRSLRRTQESPMPIPEISPQELSEKLRAPDSQWPLLVDVRSHSENQFVAFPHTLHIPLMELEERADELKEQSGK